MTLTLTRPAAPTVVRIRSAPRLEPPFDDEPASGRLPGERPAEPPLPGRGDPFPTWSQPRPAPVPRTRSAEAGAATGATSTFVTACVEVLNGARAVRQLAALVAPECFDEVAGRLLRPRGRRTGTLRIPGLPGSPGRRPGQPAPERVRVLRHWATPSGDSVLEVTSVLGRGSERWVLSVRLERRTTGWLCTHLLVL